MLAVRAINRSDDVERLGPLWRELQDRVDCDNVFVTWEWVSTWLRHFWYGRPLLFLLVEEDGRPVGLAPLLLNGRRFVLPVNRFNTRAGFLVGRDCPAVVDAVFEYLATHPPGLRASLAKLETDAPVVARLPELSERLGLVSLVTEGDTAPIIRMDGDWETFLRSRSRHFRGEHRRKENKMKQAGLVALQRVTQPQEAASALYDVMSIEALSWKKPLGTSMNGSTACENFYQQLTSEFSARKMLCIYLLRLDAVPIAHAYGLVYKNRLNVLTTAYRETYSRLSPGAVLFGRLLEDTFASGLREVDLLGEAYRWKQELTSTTRPHVSVEVYPKSLWSLGMRAYASSWKPWLKRHLPWLAKLKRGLLRSRQDCQ